MCFILKFDWRDVLKITNSEADLIRYDLVQLVGVIL